MLPESKSIRPSLLHLMLLVFKVASIFSTVNVFDELLYVNPVDAFWIWLLKPWNNRLYSIDVPVEALTIEFNFMLLPSILPVTEIEEALIFAVDATKDRFVLVHNLLSPFRKSKGRDDDEDDSFITLLNFTKPLAVKFVILKSVVPC